MSGLALKLNTSGSLKHLTGAGLQEAVDLILELSAEEIKARLEANSPVYSPQNPDVRPIDQRHPPGLFKMSWVGPFKEGPGLFSLTNTQEYGKFLEEGLYDSKQLVSIRADGTPGRLTEIDGNIYSRMINDMQGGPVASPVVTDQELIQKIIDSIALQVQAYLEGRP